MVSMNKRRDKQTLFHFMVVLIFHWKICIIQTTTIPILMPNVILEETTAGMRSGVCTASRPVACFSIWAKYRVCKLFFSDLFSGKFQPWATIGYMQGFAPRAGNVLWPLFKNILLLKVQVVLLRFVWPPQACGFSSEFRFSSTRFYGLAT